MKRCTFSLLLSLFLFSQGAFANDCRSLYWQKYEAGWGNSKSQTMMLIDELEGFFGKKTLQQMIESVLSPGGTAALPESKKLYLSYLEEFAKDQYKSCSLGACAPYEWKEFALTLGIFYLDQRLCRGDHPKSLDEIRKELFILREYPGEIFIQLEKVVNRSIMHLENEFKKIGLTEDQLRQLLRKVEVWIKREEIPSF